ncbi:MAG: hypothetical protein ACI304_09045 [Lepagella sp.]
MKLPHKPSRINFESIDMNQISKILKTGDVDCLTPAEREYFDLMRIVRGLHARMTMPGGNKIVTKAGIIKILKSDAYGLSDWMARQVYNDALNFFYVDDGVSPKAWANIYAERLDKLAGLATSMGQLKEARGLITEAAKLRGCYDQSAPEIPRELLDASPVTIYTVDAESLGAPAADRKEIEMFIDSIPDLPEISRRRVKEDAGINKKNLLTRIIEDIKEFGDEEN